MYKFIFPFYYTFHSRCKKASEKISYIFSNLIPIVIVYFLYGRENSFHTIYKDFILIIFSIFSFIEFYEIGYILNDVFTIKKEKNPTLRLTEEENKYVENNIYRILFWKLLVSMSFYFFIYYLSKKLILMHYIVTSILTLFVFYVHNNFRNNKVTFLTFFLLSVLRFSSPVLILINRHKILTVILIFIITNSLIRNFEQIGYKKYFIKNINIYKIKDKFRVYYYLSLLLLINILSFIFHINIVKINYILLYMLTYRVLTYVISIKKREVNNDNRYFNGNL